MYWGSFPVLTYVVGDTAKGNRRSAPPRDGEYPSFTRNEEITVWQDPGQMITCNPRRVPDLNEQPTRLFSTISAARRGQDIYTETALAV